MPRKKQANVVETKLEKTPAQKRYAVNHPKTAQIMRLRNQGLSCPEIGKLVDVPPSTVYAVTRSIGDMIASPEQLTAYRARQSEVMDTIAMAYGARLLDEDAIKGASALQAASVMGIAVDKSRLIQGQSSVNIAMLFSQAMDSAPQDE